MSATVCETLYNKRERVTVLQNDGSPVHNMTTRHNNGGANRALDYFMLVIQVCLKIDV
jgi:hypothetical protein